MATNSDTPTIQERYSTAVKSSNMGSDERTTRSDSDVVGAFGLADRRLSTGWVPTGKDGEGYLIREAPLAVALERLFAGDAKAAHEIVRGLAHQLWSKADNERIKPKLSRAEATDMARACLAWHRDGTCKACGGHGYAVIPGAPMLSERQCESCGGSGKIPFERAIDPEYRAPERRELARWLLSEITREMGRAGPEAMKAIAPKLEL